MARCGRHGPLERADAHRLSTAAGLQAADAAPLHPHGSAQQMKPLVDNLVECWVQCSASYQENRLRLKLQCEAPALRERMPSLRAARSGARWV